MPRRQRFPLLEAAEQALRAPQGRLAAIDKAARNIAVAVGDSPDSFMLAPLLLLADRLAASRRYLPRALDYYGLIHDRVTRQPGFDAALQHEAGLRLIDRAARLLDATTRLRHVMHIAATSDDVLLQQHAQKAFIREIDALPDIPQRLTQCVAAVRRAPGGLFEQAATACFMRHVAGLPDAGERIAACRDAALALPGGAFAQQAVANFMHEVAALEDGPTRLAAYRNGAARAPVRHALESQSVLGFLREADLLRDEPRKALYRAVLHDEAPAHAALREGIARGIFPGDLLKRDPLFNHTRVRLTRLYRHKTPEHRAVRKLLDACKPR